MTSYLDELFGLNGRTALVTGGSSGIGREIALALGRAGARVVLLARRAGPLAEVVAELEKHGAEGGAITADLADRSAVRSAVGEMNSRYGEPDILVNSAAVNLRPPLDELAEDVWDLTVEANLTSPFLLGQAFGPGMAARGWGRIINIASQQAFRAYGNSGAYGAAKAGLVGLTRSQAEAWSRHGVCANAIAPGVVHTPLTEPVFGDPSKVAAHAARTMIGRNGLPEDFAGCAVFLASGASQAVTGQTLFVDGGYSAT
ncbi:gluconate 5-dehydrogenase [Actinoplanes sp. SE50]|uniref:SDR family NAD(P)-dependent oxidoreductase n=1 Tax=unclassified Actinoplanes TaxID=2626549 RepID=UPI00023ECFAC|nr:MULTISPECIES: SDR family oxidoreductase [unclassified Actinoplanes]AEV81600.1 gluconate 5-dehydrogenase [Actinoplanes sp. SE50/110]ATO80001.1 gluconate 5-dehydrogenase [Actinoplanes sp. SE50]SLL97405.1 gluconate 5-dehydrogenase [Actinoplanes sp. SE50/110]